MVTTRESELGSLQLTRHLWILAVIWTLIVAASLTYSISRGKQEAVEAAQVEARAAYQKDIVYRRWATSHGGVYVSVDKNTPPNPYLAHVKDRDITTPSGKKLTLLNPAYMTRQVHELSAKDAGVQGHITSVKPIRPENAPDAWERQALLSFEMGKSEVSAIRTVRGEQYLRLMRPLITERACMKCHARQGYHIGDVRGGLSVAIPMKPLWAIARARSYRYILAHTLLWLISMLALSMGTGRLRQSESQRAAAARALQEEIVERRHAEEEARKAKETAEAANKAKSDFLANMSHEVRTPMNGIIGMTELALDTDLTREQREYLDSVRISAESLLELINDILDFSKIEARKLDMNPVPFDLRDSVGDTMRTLALRTHQKGLELACRILPDVPDSLVGDSYRLRQVLTNLVGNAIKFTSKGEVVVTVDVESQTDDNACLHFSVRDTGIGIPKDKQEAIFEAFEQADSSTTRKYGGTGLGLAISSLLVELMGGRIWVESEEGHGSTFHFTASLGILEKHEAASEPVDVHGLPVLVVDDNATNRIILEEMLLSWGMKPAVAESGRAALVMADAAASVGGGFDIMLFDAQMPEMDGFMLAEEVRKSESNAHAAIVMLSSSNRPEDAEQCKEVGIAACLSKPVRQSELLNTILGLMDRHPRRVAAQAPQRAVPHADRSLNILLAEDNPVNQRLALRLLEKAGHKVALAENGRQAVDLYAGGSFDLIMMDVQMPEMDGFEATAEIREQEKQTGTHVPIIALTARAMRGDRDRCLEAGMDSYISKPIKLEELFGAIGDLLDPGARAA